MAKKMDLPKMEILWKDRKRTIFGLPLSFTRYRLYEDRLITSKGFLNVVENEVMLFRIIDFKIKLRFTQRIFRVGTVELVTSDATDRELQLISIKKPREVKQLISNKVMEQRKVHNIRGIDHLDESPEESIDGQG